MPTFKFIISEAAKSWQIEKDQKDAPIFGKKIGEIISGDFLGLTGYELLITGGSDADGFPMRRDIEGVMRKRFIIRKGIGFSGKKKDRKGRYVVEGMRRKKMLRGNAIGQDIAQINCKVVKAGSAPIAKLLGKEEQTEALQPAGPQAKVAEHKAEAKPEKNAETGADAKQDAAEEKSADADTVSGAALNVPGKTGGGQQ